MYKVMIDNKERGQAESLQAAMMVADMIMYTEPEVELMEVLLDKDVVTSKDLREGSVEWN